MFHAWAHTHTDIQIQKLFGPKQSSGLASKLIRLFLCQSRAQKHNNNVAAAGRSKLCANSPRRSMRGFNAPACQMSLGGYKPSPRGKTRPTVTLGVVTKASGFPYFAQGT